MASAEQINKHIGKFVEIYGDKGLEENPIPRGQKVTVYCDDGDEEVGFAEDVTDSELGINIFIAKKWILQSDLDKLLKE